jgi:heptosyltransferase II
MHSHHLIPKELLDKKDTRILVTRTDRIGDLLLSTSVFEAIKERYPQAFLAVMALPYTAELLEGNPAVDEIIVYDKKRKHRAWWQQGTLIRMIRSRRFDCAIHLHPTNRVHWVSFLSGIPVRIGYARKSGFLLTHPIPHKKQEGTRHEAEYNYDLLSCLGVSQPRDLTPQLYLTRQDQSALDEVLKKEKIALAEASFIVNPGASCNSKMWPAERFASVTNTLSKRYGLQAIIVGDKATKEVTDALKQQLTVPFVDLCESRLTLRCLGALFTRVRFLISNDTGLVHLASAVDLPVISIFGRSDRGLGPQRWKPLGAKSLFVHKPEKCEPCEAHNCKRGFKCLYNIDINDILALVESNREMFRITKSRIT